MSVIIWSAVLVFFHFPARFAFVLSSLRIDVFLLVVVGSYHASHPFYCLLYNFLCVFSARLSIFSLNSFLSLLVCLSVEFSLLSWSAYFILKAVYLSLTHSFMLTLSSFMFSLFIR